jgi:hypothetical protein
VLVFLAALVALVAAPAGSAQREPPPAAIEQYIEQVPTSQGSRPAGVGKARKRPLPASVRKRLVEQGGTYAPTLERIATDPTVGAPARRLSPPSGQREKARGKPDGPEGLSERSERNAGDALSAAVEAAGSGSDARIIGLLVALVAITSLFGAFALRQRRAAEQ